MKNEPWDLMAAGLRVDYCASGDEVMLMSEKGEHQ